MPVPPLFATITWSSHAAIDLMDGSSQGSTAKHPGVYLQVVRGDEGKSVARYLGKSELCIKSRQVEHYDQLCDGAYCLYDGSGQKITHLAVTDQEYSTALADYLTRMTIFVGKIQGLRQAYSSNDLKAVEGLLMHSPFLAKHPSTRINVRTEEQSFTAYKAITIHHAGDPGIHEFFGHLTTWDLASRVIGPDPI